MSLSEFIRARSVAYVCRSCSTQVDGTALYVCSRVVQACQIIRVSGSGHCTRGDPLKSPNRLVSLLMCISNSCSLHSINANPRCQADPNSWSYELEIINRDRDRDRAIETEIEIETEGMRERERDFVCVCVFMSL